jgi:hypothetical protein
MTGTICKWSLATIFGLATFMPKPRFRRQYRSYALVRSSDFVPKRIQVITRGLALGAQIA